MMNITDLKGRVKLSNGVEMPYLGLGVYKSGNGDEVVNAIHSALDIGYRLIDTAAYYHNEEGVGRALNTTSVPREEIFVTTKLWVNQQKYEEALKAFDESLKKLKLDYVDLYLLHWPNPDHFLEAWKAMEDLYKDGKIRAIGVSNCFAHHLQSIIDLGGIKPMVNQIEFHPSLVQQDLLDFCHKNQIQPEAWSPLQRGEVFKESVLKDLSKKYKKSIAQIVLRWDLQKGVVTIPKSTHKERILENSELFNFYLSDEDMKKIDSLDKNERLGANPDNFMKYFKEKGDI